MTVFPLLAVSAASFIMKIVAALFLFSAVALILIILIQKGRGGGLSAAFGGGIASGILGSKTGDFLTWVTIVLVGVFLTLAVVMAKCYKPPSGLDESPPPPTTVPVGPPRSPELPTPIDDIETTTGSESIDLNTPG